MSTYSREDRIESLEVLTAFGDEAALAPHMRQARAEFWDPRLDREELPKPIAEQLQWNLKMFALVDRSIEDSSLTVLQVLLQQHGADLPAGHQAYLQALLGSYVGLYELIELRPPQGMLLRDLWTGEDLEVSERYAVQALRPHDLLAARLMRRPSGLVELEADSYALPHSAKSALIKLLSQMAMLWGEDKGERARQEPAEFFRDQAPLFQQAWIRSHFRDLP